MAVGDVARDAELTISPAIVGRVQAAAILTLTVIHVLVQIAYFGFGRDYLLGLTPLFDLDQENNIPTWYSGVVLFTTAGALGVVAAAKRQAGGPFAGHWTMLAFIFLYLSLDELTRIHEQWGPSLQLRLGGLRDPHVMGGALRNLWIIPAFLMAAVVGWLTSGSCSTCRPGRVSCLSPRASRSSSRPSGWKWQLCAVLDYANSTVGTVHWRFRPSRSPLCKIPAR